MNSCIYLLKLFLFIDLSDVSMHLYSRTFIVSSNSFLVNTAVTFSPLNSFSTSSNILSIVSSLFSCVTVTFISSTLLPPKGFFYIFVEY